MSSTPTLVRAFMFFWIGGCLVMLPALFVTAPLSSHIMRLGMACICLACCMNVASAVRNRKMWGRWSVVTPDTMGGPFLFSVLAGMHGTLAVVCAIGAFTFTSKT